jgi:murein biosynthesis integral membrane protein MurJ
VSRLKEQKAFNTVQYLIFFNLLLALIAFIKDIFLAGYFGTSNIADAINLAFFIPDTVGNNLIGASISVASIPILTKLAAGEDTSLYNKTVQKLVILVLLVTLMVLTVTLCFSAQLFHLFKINIDDSLTIIQQYFYSLTPIIVSAPFWLLGSAILQASKRFVLSAVTPILYNLLLLLILFFCQFSRVPQEIGGRIFSVGITAATTLVGLLTWYYVFKKQNVKWIIKRIFEKSESLEMRKIFTTFSAYLFILFFGQVALFYERFLASSLETGTIAALSYAYRISQFPLWVFIAAINTFILPTISLHVVKKDHSSLKRDLITSFIFVIFVSGILSMFLVFFSEPLIRIILARGSFDLHSVKLTSTILKGYGLSIVGQSLYVFCTRYYVAEGKMRVPFIIGLTGSILNIALLKFLVPLEGAIGIGYAVAISSTFNGALILAYFIKNLFVAEIKRGVTYE